MRDSPTHFQEEPALLQSNIKRLLAYSSIAHAGYILMALCVFSKDSERAVLFYLVTYVLMNLGAFVVVIGLSEAGLGEKIESYRGLGTRAPMFAAAMGVFLFSLTGIPPMAGFIGKFYLFAAVLQKGGPFYLVLAIIGILNSAVSLYYYARILKEMYFNRAEEDAPSVEVPGLHQTAALLLAIPTIGLGIFFGPIVHYIGRAVALLA